MLEYVSLDGNDLSDEAARDLLVASGCADTFNKEPSKRIWAPENATDTDTDTDTGTSTGTNTVDTGEQEHIHAWGAMEQEGKDDDESERNSGTWAQHRTAQRHPLLYFEQ